MSSSSSPPCISQVCFSFIFFLLLVVLFLSCLRSSAHHASYILFASSFSHQIGDFSLSAVLSSQNSPPARPCVSSLMNNQTLKKWEENNNMRTIISSEFLATKNKTFPLIHRGTAWLPQVVITFLFLVGLLQTEQRGPDIIITMVDVWHGSQHHNQHDTYKNIVRFPAVIILICTKYALS